MKSSRSFTVRETRRDTNFKHEKSRLCKAQCFFRFVKIYIFQRYGKIGQIDFPEKRAANKVKYLLSVRQILRNFTEGNVRKFTVSIALCAQVDATAVFLQARADYLGFRPKPVCDPKTIGSHLKHLSLFTLAILTGIILSLL